MVMNVDAVLMLNREFEYKLWEFFPNHCPPQQEPNHCHLESTEH